MTTIAFDGRVLAGDRQANWGGTPIPTRKVFKVRHPRHGAWIWGCSGSAAESTAFDRWAKGLGSPTALKGSVVLAVNEDGAIWTMDEQLVWVRLDTDCWAIGSGTDYALGAMKAGASAKEAVEIASALDVHTGLGVDCVRLW